MEAGGPVQAETLVLSAESVPVGLEEHFGRGSPGREAGGA